MLSRRRRAIEDGSHLGPPPIDPLVLPTRVLEGRGSFTVGRLDLELIPGGYGDGLIRATRHYIDILLRVARDPDLRTVALRELLAEPLEAGWITNFAPYEAMHRHNLQLVRDAP